MKRLIIASCVATLLTLVVTGSATFTGARAEKTNKYQPFGAPGDFVRGRVLVKFRDDIGTDHARQIIAALGARDADEIPHIGVHILDLPYQASELALAKAFRSRPEVEFAEVDRRLSPQQILPNDPLYPSWYLQKIDAANAWLITTGNNNITIAILDSGIEATHEDLASRIVPGRNIYNNNNDTGDVFWHGTAVAGVAGAASNNGIGVASVTWGCGIMPIRVSDSTGIATESNIASGLTWAADHGARVANVSYYVTGSKTISSAAKYFQSKGGVVAAAAGNYGAVETVQDDPYIITVGATDSQDVLFYYSNRGNNLDLVAPGNNTTTLIGGLYGGGGGTSFASPVVAGVAALVLSVNPSLTAGEVTDVLKQNADDLGNVGWDTMYGSGRVNAAKAVLAALTTAGTADTTAPVVTITSPQMGQKVTSSTTSVQVLVTDNVRVVRNELYVDGVLIATSSTAPFTTKWNARRATAGSHELQCRAYDPSGNIGLSSSLTIFK
jgi:subtilisin family serine protease